MSMPPNAQLEPCSAGCPGWALMNVGLANESIQRCDECAVFADDVAATKHVAQLWRSHFHARPPLKRLHGQATLTDADAERVEHLFRLDARRVRGRRRRVRR